MARKRIELIDYPSSYPLLKSLNLKKAILKISTGQGLVLLDQVIVSGGNFALGVLLARWLGLSAYGMFSLLWLGVLFVLGLHQAFISQPLMTLFAQKTDTEQKDYFHSIIFIQMMLSVGLIGFSTLFYFAFQAFSIERDWLEWLPLLGGLSAFYLIQDTLRKIYFAQKKYSLPLLMDGLVYVPLLCALTVLHLKSQLDLKSTLFVMLVVYGVSSTVGFLKSYFSFLGIQKATVQATLKEHYQFSIWLLGTSLLQWFSGNFFLIAAAGVLGTVAVGALRMAQNMVGLCHVLFLAMENIVPAEAAQKYFQNGKEKMYAYLKRITLLGGLPFVLGLVTLSLLAPSIIDVLYGTEYVPYSYLVWVYAAHYVLVYLGYPFRYALRTLQFTSPIFVAYCFSAGLSLVLAFPMVKVWGIMGVMAGLMLSQMVTIGVYAFFLLRKQVSSDNTLISLKGLQRNKN